MAVVLKADQYGNVHNRSLFLFQQLLLPFYPLRDRVFIRSRADRLLKQIGEKSVKVICFQPRLGKQNR
jgi:hypothetical protein